LLKLLDSSREEVVELQSKNAELEQKLANLMERPYEAVFALAACKSVDGTTQLVGMLLMLLTSLLSS
jgi:hypothetical protein